MQDLDLELPCPSLCYTDTPRGLTYPYPILVGYADTDTRIHHFSGFSFEKVCICVSDTYCIRYSYPYSCNVGPSHDAMLGAHHVVSFGASGGAGVTSDEGCIAGGGDESGDDR